MLLSSPVHSSQSMIDMDLGVKRFDTFSEGRYIEHSTVENVFKPLADWRSVHCCVKLNFQPIRKNKKEHSTYPSTHSSS